MSRKLPALKPKQIISALRKVDFYVHHQSGSHIQLRHATKEHVRVTIPFHSSFDLPSSVVSSVLKQAELTREEFLKLL